MVVDCSCLSHFGKLKIRREIQIKQSSREEMSSKSVLVGLGSSYFMLYRTSSTPHVHMQSVQDINVTADTHTTVLAQVGNQMLG